jgi:hypothetical protein
MAAVIRDLVEFTFSGMDQPTSQKEIQKNILRASIWGTMGSGGTALVSFIFSRYLIQNEPWKSIAPHVVKATLSSCVTFAALITYLFYFALTIQCSWTDDNRELINTRVSLIAKSSALVGLIGAAASALATYYVKESLLAKHSLVPLLGLAAAGSILWIFTHRQNKQLDAYNCFHLKVEDPDEE